MPIPTAVGIRALALVLLAAPAAPSASSRVDARPCGGGPATVRVQDPAAPCCFRNPRFAGTCVVQPAKDESCGQILEYLNNPVSRGRTYCSNTEIRGGWKNVACDAKR